VLLARSGLVAQTFEALTNGKRKLRQFELFRGKVTVAKAFPPVQANFGGCPASLRKTIRRRECEAVMDQLCLPSYTLSNLTQMGDAIPLLPLPTLDVPHNTQLLDDRQVAEQVQRTFHMPSAATLQRVNELLASANLDFVYAIDTFCSSVSLRLVGN